MTQSPQPTITWEFLLGFGETWRLLIPLLFLLVWVGWLTRRWWGGRLLLVSLVLLAIFAAKVTWQEQKIQRSKVEAWNRLRVRLPNAEKIDGLQLDAGTIVRWDKEHEGHLLTAELGHGQMVAPSVVVSGEVRRIADEWWRGNLVHDAVIRGWNCAAGELDLYFSGRLRWCLLSSAQKIPAGELPREPPFCSIPKSLAMHCYICRRKSECMLIQKMSGSHRTNGFLLTQMAN